MKWYDDLYVGPSLQGKEKKIRFRLNHNAGVLNAYIIALPSNPVNTLDLIPSWELKQKGYYRKKEMQIIGLAGDYEEALELVTSIVSETYQAQGDTNVASYLEGKRRMQS